MKILPVLVLSALGLGFAAEAAELKLLSQGLPASAYTGGDNKPGKGSEPPLAFDGKLDTAFSNGPTYPAWVMVDLGADYKIIKTMFYTERDNVWYAYKIEVSSDQQAWTAFVDQSKNREAADDPAFTDMGSATGRYVRLTMTDAPDRDKNPPWFWAVVKEFKVFGVPLPPPAPAPAAPK